MSACREETPGGVRVSDLAEKVHAMSGALEYSEADRTLVWTDRIGPNEYGASAIVADHVLPWVGRLIAEAADPQNRLAEAVSGETARDPA
jgi:hypothetical protein